MPLDQQNTDKSSEIRDFSSNTQENLQKAMELAIQDRKISKQEIQALREVFTNQKSSIDKWLLKNKDIILYEAKDELDVLKQDLEKTEFYSRFPEFKNLIESHPDRFSEFKKRVLLYTELKKVKSKLQSDWTAEVKVQKSESKNIETIMNLLSSNPDNTIFTDSKLKTKIEGWNSSSSINYRWTGNEELSYSEYILRLTNKNAIVNELFSSISQSVEINNTQKEQLQRARIFMDSLVSRNPNLNMNNKKEVNDIYNMFSAGDVSVLSKINTLTKKQFSGLVIDFSSQDGLADGLRSIGDTQTSGMIMYGEINARLELQDSDIDQNKQKIYTESYQKNIDLTYQREKYRKVVDIRYNEILTAMKDDPTSDYFAIVNDRNAQEQLRTSIQEMLAFDLTIKEVGSEGLGDLTKVYDDMKGLNGAFNFSDENVKMTKEMSIIVGSMLLTFGASSIFGAVAGGARAVQVARTTAQMKNVQNGQRIRGVANATTASIASGVAKTTEALALGINQIRNVKIVGEAVIFTTAEGVLHEVLKAPGENKQDLEDFAYKLTLNTAMFGMFAGMGKIVGGISTKLGYHPETATSLQRIMKFSGDTSGDMAAMYALHLIQTGKLEMSAEEFAIMAAQVIGFRGGMEMMSKMYPNGKLTQTMEKHIIEHRGKVLQSRSGLRDAKIGRENANTREQYNQYLKEQGIKVNEKGEYISTWKKGFIDQNIVSRNFGLDNVTRLQEVTKISKFEFQTQAQKDLFIRVHEMPNMSPQDRFTKAKILREELGMTEKQVRIVMERGLAGKASQAGHGELTDAKLRELASQQGKTEGVLSSGLNSSRERVIDQQQLRNLLQIHVKKPGDTLNLGEKLGSQYDGYIITKLGGRGNNYELTLPDGTKRNFTGNEKFRRELQAHLAGRESINLPMKLENLSISRIPEGGLKLVKGKTYQLTEILPNSNLPIGTKLSGDLSILPNGMVKGNGIVELPNGIKVKGNFNESTFVDGKVNGVFEMIYGNTVIHGELKASRLFNGTVKENGVVVSKYENGILVEGKELYQNNLLKSLPKEQFIFRETGKGDIVKGSKKESITIEGEAIRVGGIKPLLITEQFILRGNLAKDANSLIKERSLLLKQIEQIGMNNTDKLRLLERLDDINSKLSSYPKMIKTIKIENLKTPEQARSWLKDNWGKLVGAGVIALSIGGATYLATRDENDDIDLVPVPTKIPIQVPEEAPIDTEAPVEAVNENIDALVKWNNDKYTKDGIKLIQEKLGVEQTGTFSKEDLVKIQELSSGKDGKVGLGVLKELGLVDSNNNAVGGLKKDMFQSGKLDNGNTRLIKFNTTSVPVSAPKSAQPAAAPVEISPTGSEIQQSFNYDDLRQAIKNYNNNETRFIFPEGSEYFGDNFSSERFSGFAIKKGREDFRLIINIDGTFNLLNSTGIEYHDIGEKAKIVNTGIITMKGDKFDLSQVLSSGK